jgi:hypothetical protein
VDARQIRRYETGEQEPLFTAAVAIAAALRVPLAELAGLSAELAAGSAQTPPRVRRGIEFSARDDLSGGLRVTGDDDAAVHQWAGAWLDEHRDWAVTGITFRYRAVPGTRGRQRPWCSNSLARGCPRLRT